MYFLAFSSPWKVDLSLERFFYFGFLDQFLGFLRFYISLLKYLRCFIDILGKKLA